MKHATLVKYYYSYIHIVQDSMPVTPMNQEEYGNFY